MIQQQLKQYLNRLGASLVGFADLREIDPASRQHLDYGIAVAMRLSPEVIQGIDKGPTQAYYDQCQSINQSLDGMVVAGVAFIQELGYRAIGQTSTFVTRGDDLTTPLPHKTVATRAGLGWIGKSALLITPEYGSGLRLSSILTDMPLAAALPFDESRCGGCIKCREACPAEAIKGALWNVSMSRSDLVDPYKCREKARELLKRKIGVESATCGKCIEACPYTKRYAQRGLQ